MEGISEGRVHAPGRQQEAPVTGGGRSESRRRRKTAANRDSNSEERTEAPDDGSDAGNMQEEQGTPKPSYSGGCGTLDREGAGGQPVSKGDVPPEKIHPALPVCVVKKCISCEATGRQKLTNQVIIMSFFCVKTGRQRSSPRLRGVSSGHLPGVKKCT